MVSEHDFLKCLHYNVDHARYKGVIGRSLGLRRTINHPEGPAAVEVSRGTGITSSKGCLSPEDLVNLSANPISRGGSCFLATTIFSLSPDVPPTVHPFILVFQTFLLSRKRTLVPFLFVTCEFQPHRDIFMQSHNVNNE